MDQIRSKKRGILLSTTSYVVRLACAQAREIIIVTKLNQRQICVYMCVVDVI